MIVGDSPQAMTVNLSVADAEKFLANRKAAGFNSVVGQPSLHHLYSMRAGELTARPTTAYRLSRPPAISRRRTRRTSHVLIAWSASRRSTDRLVPRSHRDGGWLSHSQGNSVDKAYGYGRYLGKRYRKFPNIVWFSGNDFQTWRNRSDAALVQAVARGIKASGSNPSADGRAQLLSSAARSMTTTWRALIRLDAVYTYCTDLCGAPEGISPARPSSDVHGRGQLRIRAQLRYSTDLETLRRQEYWTMLSGASGQLYGNKYTWQFLDGWQDHLDTPVRDRWRTWPVVLRQATLVSPRP